MPGRIWGPQWRGQGQQRAAPWRDPVKVHRPIPPNRRTFDQAASSVLHRDSLDHDPAFRDPSRNASALSASFSTCSHFPRHRRRRCYRRHLHRHHRRRCSNRDCRSILIWARVREPEDRPMVLWCWPIATSWPRTLFRTTMAWHPCVYDIANLSIDKVPWIHTRCRERYSWDIQDDICYAMSNVVKASRYDYFAGYYQHFLS